MMTHKFIQKVMAAKTSGANFLKIFGIFTSPNVIFQNKF